MAIINGTVATETITGTNLDDGIYGGPTTDPNATGTGADTIYGGGGNDTIYGQDGNDNLYGGAAGTGGDLNTGNDILHGGDGNDWLYGQDGADQLFGDAGGDALQGGAGNDALDGGADGDYLSGGTSFSASTVETGTGDDTLIGGAGNDQIYGQDGNDTLNGGDGDDALYGQTDTNTLNGQAGNDMLVSIGINDVLDGGNGGETAGLGDQAVIDRSGATIALAMALDSQVGDVKQNLGDGTQLTNVERLDFTGGSGDDVIAGRTIGTWGDTLRGGGGSDTLRGGGGADQLFGGAGNDTLDGGTDIDHLFGGATNADTETGTGDDVMRGGDGNDWLHGQDGVDHLFGEAGGDALLGGAGNDTLDGGADNDSLTGGTSFSTATVETGTGDDVLDGGAGADTLVGGDGNDTLTGGDGDDTLHGQTGTNTLNGNAGNDTLVSISAGDTIDGGNGGETAGPGDQAVLDRSGASMALSLALDAQVGDVKQNLGDGTQITNIERLDFTGGAGNDVITGLTAGSFGDTLRGGGGNDTLRGGAGGDHLFGAAGGDTLEGGTDNDYLYGGATSADTETGTGDDVLRGGDGIDWLRGQDGNDQLFGDAGGDALLGGAGNDTIDGGADGDTVSGGNTWQEAVLETGTGDDTLAGGAGNDTLLGFDGNDTLSGGDGDDRLLGHTGTNALSGDAGDDTLISAGLNDVIDGGSSGEANGDLAVLNRGAATVGLSLSLDAQVGGVLRNLGDGTQLTNIERLDFTGGAGNDVISGLSAGSFSDTLRGGAGNDTLNGGGGTNTLIGGAGNDTLDGGIGSNTTIEYGGVRADYQLDFLANNRIEIVDLRAGSPDGTDTAGSVSAIRFADMVLQLSPSGTDKVITINEDASHTVAVADFGFTDPNQNDSMSAVRIETLPAAGSFTLAGAPITAGQVISAAAINGGQLVFTPAPNANGIGYASFTFSVIDQGGTYDPSPNRMTFSVTAVNDAPVITSNGGGASAALSVPENTNAVTTVIVSDPDGPSLQYSIDGGADAAKFTINANTGALSFISSPNYELPADAGANNVYDVIVKASDGQASDTQAIAVTVTDVNENTNVAPVITSNGGGAAATITLAENTAAVTTVTATDADIPAQTLTYSISGGADAAKFAINASTGALSFVTAPNVEAPADAGANNVYDVVVQVSDGNGGTDNQAISVALADVDEFDVGAVTDNNSVANAVAENSATGTVVGVTAAASDADATNNAITYSLSDNAGGRFAINGSTGMVTVANGALLDYETATSHNITVRATSADGSFSTRSFAIAVTNVSEAGVGPVSDSNAAANSVAENAVSGTAVGISANAIDPDAGDSVGYSLTDSAGGRFAINAATGVVTVANGALLDREAAASHDIIVKATSSDGSFSTATFTIGLTDVDEFDVGTVTDSNSVANSVAENAANGTVVGITALATDADATNSTIAYSLSDNAGGRFAINGSTGVVTIANGALLDFETATSHNVTVRATSADGSFSTQSFAIGVTNVAEAGVGPVTDANSAANTVAENAVNGAAVGITAGATDPDAADTVSYSLTDSAGGRFAINAASGVVTVANGALLNREAAASHDITVKATSADGSFSIATFTIGLTDVDEFDVGAVNDSNSLANSVAENAANGTVVGITALASDGDATNNAISYSLSDNAGGRFAINASTGVVSVANGALLDYETATSHNVTVRATSADGSFSAQSFSIAVTNVSEAGIGPVSDANSAAESVAENAANGTTVGITAAAIDPDAGDTVSYSLTDSAGGRFAISATTGVVTVANGALLNREAAASHDIAVKATSSDGSFSTKVFTIGVTDVDEFDIGAIVDVNTAVDRVAENAANGTAVGITALAADADATNNAVTYALTDSAGGRFAIDAMTGVVTVANGALLDFEAASSHAITVRATSADGSTASQGFTIALTDVAESGNQAPTANADRIVTNVDHGAQFALPTWALLANDTDPEGAPLALTAVTSFQGGLTAFDSVTAGTHWVSIDTGAGFVAPRSATFTYQVSDGAAPVSGTVTVVAGGGRSFLSGTSASEIIVDNGNAHYVSAGAGDDILFGNGGNDALHGGDGNDWLDGGEGRDSLGGGFGNDVLRGGAGTDWLRGGAGADRFDFDAVSESGRGNAADLIRDFSRLQGDRIDLSDIDAMSSAAGDQAFSASLLAGLGTAFTGAGQLRFGYDSATNQTILQGNVDADLNPDFEIHLVGNVALTAADFLL